MAEDGTPVPIGIIETIILLVRGQRVVLDADLAQLYGVTTKRLNEQVKRNSERFPDDFMFQLSSREKVEVVAKCDHLHRLKFSSTRPFAFTEHGVLMAANVLNSGRAVEMSVLVVRAFVRLRKTLESHSELAHKLREMERTLLLHDDAITALVNTIKHLINPPESGKRHPVGFKP